ncbi:hypothetical protein RD01_18485 [Pectobacterium carotovorum subsp. carotovorum]|nr:hypothetical protein RD01_18485 [Pectobacterium carotovorum subsp. carotovorum]
MGQIKVDNQYWKHAEGWVYIGDKIDGATPATDNEIALHHKQAVATARVSDLTRAASLKTATDEQKVSLKEWEGYAAMLSSIDVNATGIAWPLVPDDELIAIADQ